MRLLEKDNKRLRKSVSTLQKYDKDDDDDSSISSVEGSVGGDVDIVARITKLGEQVAGNPKLK
jgi:hypothetical protein